MGLGPPPHGVGLSLRFCTLEGASTPKHTLCLGRAFATFSALDGPIYAAPRPARDLWDPVRIPNVGLRLYVLRSTLRT